MLPFNDAARHNSQANHAMSPAPETIVPTTLLDAGTGRRDKATGATGGALTYGICMFVSMVMGV